MRRDVPFNFCLKRVSPAVKEPRLPSSLGMADPAIIFLGKVGMWKGTPCLAPALGRLSSDFRNLEAAWSAR